MQPRIPQLNYLNLTVVSPVNFQGARSRGCKRHVQDGCRKVEFHGKLPLGIFGIYMMLPVCRNNAPCGIIGDNVGIDDKASCIDQLLSDSQYRSKRQIRVVHHQIHNPFNAPVQVKGHIKNVLSGNNAIPTHCCPPFLPFPGAVLPLPNPCRRCG